MREAFADVIAFETRCGHPLTNGPPGIPDANTGYLRYRLVEEETIETLNALNDENLPKIADGLADLIWVCLGTAVRLGIDLPAVWDEVRRTNMAKFGPGSHRLPSGKLGKPPGWTPPDVEAVLASQAPLGQTYASRIHAKAPSVFAEVIQ